MFSHTREPPRLPPRRRPLLGWFVRGCRHQQLLAEACRDGQGALSGVPRHARRTVLRVASGWDAIARGKLLK